MTFSSNFNYDGKSWVIWAPIFEWLDVTQSATMTKYTTCHLLNLKDKTHFLRELWNVLYVFGGGWGLMIFTSKTGHSTNKHDQVHLFQTKSNSPKTITLVKCTINFWLGHMQIKSRYVSHIKHPKQWEGGNKKPMGAYGVHICNNTMGMLYLGTGGWISKWWCDVLCPVSYRANCSSTM